MTRSWVARSSIDHRVRVSSGLKSSFKILVNKFRELKCNRVPRLHRTKSAVEGERIHLVLRLIDRDPLENKTRLFAAAARNLPQNKLRGLR